MFCQEHTFFIDDTIDSYSRLLKQNHAAIFTQYSVEKGFKLFGDSGTEAVNTELLQIDQRDVVEPVHDESMTRDEKLKTLKYLMYLKKKRYGRIKGRGCADGRKQRAYIEKEDASAPTAHIESVFLSCTIDAYEKRDVATVDIPGALMHANMNEVVHMRIDGSMAALLAKINPDKYEKYVKEERGRPVMYVRLKKALYGALRAAFLFWKLLTETLISWGFQLNDYDRCVANKMIDGKQCTILWHVDDLKISHESPDLVSDVLKN